MRRRPTTVPAIGVLPASEEAFCTYNSAYGHFNSEFKKIFRVISTDQNCKSNIQKTLAKRTNILRFADLKSFMHIATSRNARSFMTYLVCHER
jgi:uncharacterized protein (DUF2225 family)